MTRSRRYTGSAAAALALAALLLSAAPRSPLAHDEGYYMLQARWIELSPLLDELRLRRRRLEQAGSAVLRDVVGRQRHLALVGRRAAQLHRAVDAPVLQWQSRRFGQLIGTDDLQSGQ